MILTPSRSTMMSLNVLQGFFTDTDIRYTQLQKRHPERIQLFINLSGMGLRPIYWPKYLEGSNAVLPFMYYEHYYA